jgi:2'-5' RNA ligase
MPSGVVLRTPLPASLERIRRRHVFSATLGVPAHATLLHPFIEPEELRPAVRRRLREVAADHRPFDYRLDRMAEWPDAIYVAVDPVEPFVRLQRDLQAAFPDWPIYGAGADFEFEPHITVADGAGKLEPGIRDDPAWRALPLAARAEAIDVIATRPDGRWRLIWRIPLGPSPADRIQP